MTILPVAVCSAYQHQTTLPSEFVPKLQIASGNMRLFHVQLTIWS